MLRLSILLLALFFLITCKPSENIPANDRGKTLYHACAYLWDKQSQDGGWHSEVHGILKGGQAWTPFVFKALMAVPDSIYIKDDQSIKAALNFIRRHISKDGVMGVSDPEVVEYPNYSTAYALMCLAEFGNIADLALVHSMSQYLLKEQFIESRGFSSDSLIYGGWGFGEQTLSSGQAGYVDLSHTRRVLQALRITGHNHKAAYNSSKHFLRLLQKHPDETRWQPNIYEQDTLEVYFDGGFYFSPKDPGSNKAKIEEENAVFQAHFRSYATATCDGILSLLASGEKSNNESVRAAKVWLAKHPNLAKPGGFAENDETGWDEVMIFYHLAVRSEVYAALKWPGSWREDMLAIIMKEQLDDGSFSNPEGGPNKEDDPILATALVVIALSNGIQ